MSESVEYLNINEVSSIFPHLTPSALYSQRSRGQYPGALGVKVGSQLLWKRSDLEEWFDSQKVAANAR